MPNVIAYNRIYDFPVKKLKTTTNILNDFEGYFLLDGIITYGEISRNGNVVVLVGKTKSERIVNAFKALSLSAIYRFVYISWGECRNVRLVKAVEINKKELEYEFSIELELQNRINRMHWSVFSKMRDIGIMGDKLEVSGFDNLRQKFFFITNSFKGETMMNMEFGSFTYQIDKLTDIGNNEKAILATIEIIENTTKTERTLDGSNEVISIQCLEKIVEMDLLSYVANDNFLFSLTCEINGHGNYAIADLSIRV